MFGTKYERQGVRPRGTLLSAAAFNDLPCAVEPVTVGETIYYRCGSDWYQRIEHEGWTCYSEIWPPAGARVRSLPSGHVRAQAGERAVYATDEALYAPDPLGAGYVVVEPVAGLRVDRLPESATDGIPVLVNGVTYHRHLGVFYREETGPDGAKTYVVSESPFALPYGQAATVASRTPPSTPPGARPTVNGYDVYGTVPAAEREAPMPGTTAVAAPSASPVYAAPSTAGAGSAQLPAASVPPPSFYTGPGPAYVAPSSGPGSPGALLGTSTYGVGSPGALPPEAAPGSPHAPLAR